MADNVLDSGPPSAKRPKLSSPALSVSASDGNDFGSFFDLEHDLPDELINSGDLGLPNGGDLGQLHTSLGTPGGSVQDTVAKHKQLSELLRAGAPVPATSAAGGQPPMGLMGSLGASPGPQGLVPPQQQQAGVVGGLSRGMMGGQVMNGSPRMGYPNPGMGSSSNLLAETLQQQGGQQMGHGPGLRPQQPGALNKMAMMGNAGPYGSPYGPAAGQALGGPGLGTQLQNKAGLPNSMAQFNNMDKKPSAVGGPGSGQPGLASMATGPGAAAAAPPTADPEKRKLIQQQLVLLLHAHKCQRREQANGEVRQCNLPHCRTMKNVLNHMTHCQAGKSCQVAHCASSRQIISHWKNCTRHDCPVCLPLKNAGDKRNQQSLLGSAGVGLGSALGAVPGGQPSAPSLNPPSQIDPSSIERAYAALGLTYQGNQMPAQPPQSSLPTQGLQGQAGMRPLGARGESGGNPMGVNGGVGVQPPNQQTNLLQDPMLHRNTNSQSLMNDGTGVGNLGAMPTAAPPSAAGLRKTWHEDITQDLRNHLVHKLVQAIFPTPDPAALKDRRMENLVAYARKVEGDMYESANSRAEYYHLLAEKIYKIQKELEEKRRTRLQKQGMMPTQPGMPQSGLPQGPPGLGQPPMAQMATPPTLPVSSPAGQPGSAPTPGSGAPMGSMMPGSGPGSTSQPNSHTHCPPLRQNSPSPARSLTPTPHPTMPGSQTPQPHTPNPPQMVAPVAQQPQSQPMVAEKAGPQQLHGGGVAAGLQTGLPSSVPVQNSHVPTPHPRTPVSIKTSLPRCPAVPCGHTTSSFCPQLSQKSSLTADGPASTPASVSSADPSSQLAPSDAVMAPESKAEVKQQPVEEDEGEADGKPVKKEEPPSDRCKSEPMDTSSAPSYEDKKPEIKTEAKEEEDGGSASTGTPGSAAAAQSKKKIFKPEELRQALMPTLEALYRQDPESLPFRQPVDPQLLGIPDYFDIVKNPMDLSTIKRKLDTGQYQEPWQYVDDIWLMFSNAWLYNRKTSRVYKYCSKLAEVFEQEIDPVMQGLGYCCGRKLEFSPQTLCCYGKQLCTIPRDAAYFSYQNSSPKYGLLADRYHFCEKCFNEIQGESVSLGDDPSQPQTSINKDQFQRKKNDTLDPELLVECTDCGRKMHQICVLHNDTIWPSGFICDGCLKKCNKTRKENKYASKRLPQTKLGNYLETRVNEFLRRQNHPESGDVTIRVVHVSDKVVEVKPGMKARFVDSGEMAESFPYRTKALFAFEDIDGADVCFFGMHVQEYGSDCPPPNQRRVYISYLDSVHFFQPRHLRTGVYHEILIGYLEYVRKLGFTTGHIWACPPSEGDDYIFHCHPADQKIPKPKRLQEWYKKMLDKSVTERIVHDYKDIFKQATEDRLTSAKELPYFEGDFWPNVLEESIKELEQEEEERKREENSTSSESASKGDSKNAKKKNSKKTSKNKSSLSRANKKKPGMPNVSNDLSQKLYATMEKHKEVFFVIRLIAGPTANSLPPISDPDPLMACDLMDGRDAFLTLARDKHLEFSSLRRAKWSTMCMLVELHNQSQDRFVYTCNECKHHVETRFHCTVCEDYDLCAKCYNTKGHEHKMDKLGLGLDDEGNSQAAASTQSPGDSRRLSIQRCIQSLVHACQCRNANCSLPSCQKMKRVVQHTKGCKRKTNGGCPICKQLIALCCYHAKHCQEAKCPVPFCLNIKHKLRQQQLQHRLQQAQMLRRRMASMQRTGQPACGGATPGGLPSPGNNGITGPSTPTSGGTQPPTPRTPIEPFLSPMSQQGVGESQQQMPQQGQMQPGPQQPPNQGQPPMSQQQPPSGPPPAAVEIAMKIQQVADAQRKMAQAQILQRQAAQAGMMPPMPHHQQPQGQMGIPHQGAGMVGPMGMPPQGPAGRAHMDQPQPGPQGMMVGPGPMQQPPPQQPNPQGQLPPQILQQQRVAQQVPNPQQQWAGQPMQPQQRPGMMGQMGQPGMVGPGPPPQQQQQLQQQQQHQQQLQGRSQLMGMVQAGVQGGVPGGAPGAVTAGGGAANMPQGALQEL
uniref:histone acetyltransferase n=1 Tax=Denticeps clupeoides TaxID=299321 RepID=A0AAY4BVG8_9TELE